MNLFLLAFAGALAANGVTLLALSVTLRAARRRWERDQGRKLVEQAEQHLRRKR